MKFGEGKVCTPGAADAVGIGFLRPGTGDSVNESRNTNSKSEMASHNFAGKTIGWGLVQQFHPAKDADVAHLP